MRILLQEGAENVLIVGGWVRDWLLNVESKDIDIEVYGMTFDRIQSELEDCCYSVDAIGKSFGVLKVDNEIDISMPRRDNKIGAGHKGFSVEIDPSMSVKDAASRRDFTINTMGVNVEGILIDPFSGSEDLQDGLLRAVDSSSFGEDPLRVLRGMQFAARFNFAMEEETVQLCKTMISQKSSLPKERVWGEWYKWAVKGTVPSAGLKVLKDTGWLDPEIAALVDLPQDEAWHPEGWSLTFRNNCSLPLNSSSTSSTKSNGGDFRLALGKFLTASLADLAASEEASATFGTQTTIVDRSSFGLGTTSTTGTNSFSPTSLPLPTTVTFPKSFVWTGLSAVTTDKVVRVMFEISRSSMSSIVRSSVNDFQVGDIVIAPIAIYVMDMLVGRERSPKLQFHKKTVDTYGPVSSWPTDVRVSSVVANTPGQSIDGDVVYNFCFDLCFTGDVQFVHSPHNVDKDATQPICVSVSQGHVYTHTCHVVDQAARIATRENLGEDDRLILMFAALCHDFGKATTTKFEDGRWKAKGHCETGIQPAEEFLTRIGAPLFVVEHVKKLIVEHLVHAGNVPTTRLVRRLANRLYPAKVEILSLLIEADHSGRPPLPKGNPFLPWMEVAQQVQVQHGKPKPILMGRHLLDAGMKPGVAMGKVLDQAFEAQLDGVFDNLEGALVWVQTEGWGIFAVETSKGAPVTSHELRHKG